MSLPPRRTTLWKQPDLTHSVLDDQAGPFDAVVIGAGIVGLTTAALLAEDGARVVVLEDRYAGAGTTGFSTAKVTVLHGVRYQKITQRAGAEAAANYARANNEALDWIRARAAADPELTRWEEQAAFTVAAEDDERQTVDDEVEAARAAGLPVEAVGGDAVGLPFPTSGAVRLGGQGQFDSGAFLELLARQATDAGAVIVTGVRATGVERRDGKSVVQTSRGTVTGSWVVVATGLPFLDRAALFARAEAKTSYAVAGRLDGDLPEGMHLSAGASPWSVRTAQDPDRDGGRLLVVGGGGHKTGHLGSSTVERYERLVAFGGRFGAFEPTHRWGAEDFVAPDGLPYVGGSKLLPADVLVATGFGKWGITTGVASAKVLAARIGGAAAQPWAPDWDVGRVGARQVGTLARLNGDVAARLAGGWLGALKPKG
ncbi:MAG: FAD-binding oxidoreductase, partial [Acidimicrobiia bacterium]|nr:FAD-binding oxidoreductase [Acidimicrobiia bacterium]